MVGVTEIQEILPHRYPFLLVDRILEIELGKRVVGVKNVTINEPFFAGHFPGHPIMPGVLILEAMAQVGGFLLMRSLDLQGAKAMLYFTGIDRARFRRPVVPGDQIRFEVSLVQLRRRMCRMKGVALVDGKIAAEAAMSAVVVDRDAEGPAPGPLVV
jgi:beta-hydroxyacyl-ACP dehydratase FabZ